MADGRGALECCYCQHYFGRWTGYDAAHEPGFCAFHKTELPASKDHRICTEFKPNDAYQRDNAQTQATVEDRFSEFGGKLKDGILYGFGYDTPNEVSELKALSSQGGA